MKDKQTAMSELHSQVKGRANYVEFHCYDLTEETSCFELAKLIAKHAEDDVAGSHHKQDDGRFSVVVKVHKKMTRTDFECLTLALSKRCKKLGGVFDGTGYGVDEVDSMHGDDQ